MIKFSFKLFKSFFIQRTGSFLLIVFGLFLTIFGFYFILSRGFYVYEYEAVYNNESKTLILKMNDENDSKVAENLFTFLTNKSPEFPVVNQIKAYNSYNEIVGQYLYEMEHSYIPYGRYFTEEEQFDGSNVVILSESFVNQLDSNSISSLIGNEISIGNNPGKLYLAIGRYNTTFFGDEMDSKEVIIPFFTYIKNGYALSEVEIIFSDKLTETELFYLEDFFSEYKGIEISKYPAKLEYSAIISFLYTILHHSVVLVICLITLLTLIGYWIRINYKKFYIYYICGSTKGFIMKAILLNVSYIWTVSTILALTVYKRLELYFFTYGYLSVLNVLRIMIISVFILAIVLFTTWIMSSKQLKKYGEIREIGI